MKSLRSTGIDTAAAISTRYSSLPRKYLGSVNTEIPTAPYISYSLAVARGSKSRRIIPFDGDACLTSAMIPSPKACLTACFRSRPVRRMLLWSSFGSSRSLMISSSGRACFRASTCLFLSPTIFWSIMTPAAPGTLRSICTMSHKPRRCR